MGQSAIPAAIAARNFELIRAAIVGELIVTIPSATDPQTWDAREKGVEGGAIWPAVNWQERIWFRDPDDTDTDHDELTCIVTLDGSRYLTNDVRFGDTVLSRTIDTPPDEEDLQYGDTFLVPAGANDDWATQEDKRAMWTARGWRYKPKRIGELVYVADPVDLGFIHVNADDEWENGVGPRNLIDSSVLPRHLLIRAWNFIDQTTTAPPASGPAGEQYVIGAGATGAWAGHDLKMAWRPALDAAFVITEPFVGEEGRDQNLNIKIAWTGSAWVPASGALVGFKVIPMVNSGGLTSINNVTNYNFNHTTPPSRAASPGQRMSILATPFVFRVRRLGNVLRIRVKGVVAGTTTNGYLGLWRNAETLAIDWTHIVGQPGTPFDFAFLITPDTTDPVDYYIGIGRATSESADIERRVITLEEFLEG